MTGAPRERTPNPEGKTQMPFTEDELSYYTSQNLGRLATVAPGGQPQANPVSFRINTELGTIDIGGRNLTESRKFRNVLEHEDVAFVVDDLVSTQPWTARGIEVRGRAEALTDAQPPHPYFGTAMIRIHPRRIITWGIGEDTAMHGRNV